MLPIAIVGGLILLVNMGPGKCMHWIVRLGESTHSSFRRSVGGREEEDLLGVLRSPCGLMSRHLKRVSADVDVERVRLSTKHGGRKDPGTMGQLDSIVSFAKTWHGGNGPPYYPILFI